MTKETYLKGLQAILERNDKQIAIAELENIKAELNCKYSNNYKYSAVTVACILNDLDNHIAELKGEKNEH